MRHLKRPHRQPAPQTAAGPRSGAVGRKKKTHDFTAAQHHPGEIFESDRTTAQAINFLLERPFQLGSAQFSPIIDLEHFRSRTLALTRLSTKSLTA